MCVYISIYIYVCLYISEMNDNNDTRMEDLALFCYFNVMLFETGFKLVVNVCWKL